jgi:mRNA-degrading endonuclease RelE of RelBE toxin-antitoxin system
MTNEDQILAEAKEKIKKLKKAKIKQWTKKLDALKNRKENPIREAEFCRLYGINQSRFNRCKNDKEPSLPSDSFFTLVDNAFKSEGV